MRGRFRGHEDAGRVCGGTNGERGLAHDYLAWAARLHMQSNNRMLVYNIPPRLHCRRPRLGRIVRVCAIGMAVLHMLGHRAVSSLDGGIDGWRNAGNDHGAALTRSAKRFEPVTFVRSPIITKLVSSVIVSGSSPASCVAWNQTA